MSHIVLCQGCIEDQPNQLAHIYYPTGCLCLTEDVFDTYDRCIGEINANVSISQNEKDNDTSQRPQTEKSNNNNNNINMVTTVLSQKIQTETCAVCLDSFDELLNVTITECGHIFHSSCMFKVIKSGNYDCPICRTVLYTSTNNNMATHETMEDEIDIMDMDMDMDLAYEEELFMFITRDLPTMNYNEGRPGASSGRWEIGTST